MARQSLIERRSDFLTLWGIGHYINYHYIHKEGKNTIANLTAYELLLPSPTFSMNKRKTTPNIISVGDVNLVPYKKANTDE